MAGSPSIRAMMKRWMPITTAAMLAVSAGCGKKEVVSSGAPEAVEAVAVAGPAYAGHLRFATRVPGDVDLYVAGYDADEAARGFMDSLLSSGITKDEDAPAGDKFLEAMPYIGDEAFLWVGPGAGGKLEMIGTSYRDLSAAWAWLRRWHDAQDDQR